MFGLQYRGELPEIVERELEALVVRIKRYLLSGHNDDGTHKGITYSGTVTNITVVDGIVTDVS